MLFSLAERDGKRAVCSRVECYLMNNSSTIRSCELTGKLKHIPDTVTLIEVLKTQSGHIGPTECWFHNERALFPNEALYIGRNLRELVNSW